MPAVRRAFDDRVGERAEHHHDEALSDRVRPARSGRPRLGDESRGQRDGGQADRDVDPEHAPPADRLDQDAAQHRAERHGQGERAAPGAEGPGAFGAVGERVGDDRHRNRVEHGPADRLHHPERDQPAQPGRQTAQPRADREHGQSGLERSSASDPVGGRAGQHQQAGQHERVGVYGPLQPGHRGVQVPPDGGQRDVDDGAIQADDKQAEAADDEHERAPTAAELWQRYHPDWLARTIASLQLTICVGHAGARPDS